MLVTLAATLLVSTAITAAPEQTAQAQDSPELVRARKRAIEFLIEQQDNGEIKEYSGQEGGIPALVTLALLKSGVKPPAKRKSELLEKVRATKPESTYVISLQTLVLCAAEPKKDLDAIRRNVKWLEGNQVHNAGRAGSWNYGDRFGPSKGDNSNTQFAMLALHEADLAGASASENTWRLALDHWLNEQLKDGSWGYYAGMDGTGSMTCAGVACVSIASRHVNEKAKVEAAGTAVKRAEKWLTKNFTVLANPPSKSTNVRLWHFCYLYDLERAARLARWSKLGDHDWRAEGVRLLLKEQNEDGSWRGSGFAETDPVLATSLALLFLRPETPEKPQATDKH